MEKIWFANTFTLHFLRACFSLIDPLHLTSLTEITHSFIHEMRKIILTFFASGNRSQSRHILRFLTLFDLVFRMFQSIFEPQSGFREKRKSIKNEFLSIKEYGTRLRYDENILLSNVDVSFLFTPTPLPNLGAFYCLENSVAICKWYFY